MSLRWDKSGEKLFKNIAGRDITGSKFGDEPFAVSAVQCRSAKAGEPREKASRLEQIARINLSLSRVIQ